jgi:hypothetical protein
LNELEEMDFLNLHERRKYIFGSRQFDRDSKYPDLLVIKLTENEGNRYPGIQIDQIYMNNTG